MRGSFWNDVPRSTVIIIEDIMIDRNDTKYGGDIWCFDWMVGYFGPNITFRNCYVARNDRLEDRGRYTTIYDFNRDTQF